MHQFQYSDLSGCVTKLNNIENAYILTYNAVADWSWSDLVISDTDIPQLLQLQIFMVDAAISWILFIMGFQWSTDICAEWDFLSNVVD